MTVEEKGYYFFTKYQEAFVLIALTVLLMLNLDLGVKVSLLVAAAVAVVAIVIYFIQKLAGFFFVSFAVGAAIAGLCEHFHIGITWFKGDGHLSVTTVAILLAIIEILYVTLQKSIIEKGHRKLGIFLAVLISAGVSGAAIYLHELSAEYFSGIHLVAPLFMVVFLSSIISSMFLNGKWTLERVLMVSYVIGFVLVFAIVVSIVLEDDFLLELIFPDDAISKKHKKKA